MSKLKEETKSTIVVNVIDWEMKKQLCREINDVNLIVYVHEGKHYIEMSRTIAYILKQLVEQNDEQFNRDKERLNEQRNIEAKSN